MPKTVIAFDFGTARIGVAVGQTATYTAQELTPVQAKDGIPNWEIIQKLISEWGADLLVVGLPLNMDDSAGDLSNRAKKFANRLREKFQLEVELMDERLSTFSAKGELLAQGVKLDPAKKPVDSIAARLILESWFNEQKPANN